ncbi:patched domain-containing protein 3-like [Argopecten irradians]|uniref:patched domain-containing protein 3-like n=1 Tax=Argopecten irradians TaxID=31199 RepID=UPI00370FC3D2
MKVGEFYVKYEKRVGAIFERYGSFATHYPWYLIVVCLMLNTLMAIGLMRVKSESHVEVLYTPMGSQAYTERAAVSHLFPDESGINFNMLSLVDLGMYGQVMIRTRDGSTILNDTLLEEVETIDGYINGISVQDPDTDQEKFYADVCALDADGCGIYGKILFTNTFRSRMHINNISYPKFNREAIAPIFGNTTVENGTLIYASMVKLRYYLRTDTAENRYLSRQWERAFVESMENLVTNMTEVAYEHSDSLNVELNGNTAGRDTGLFSITFTIMLFYAGFATSGGDCISQRQNLGRAGVLTTLLSIAASFGLVSGFGVKFVNIVGVMPFLLVGIGLDDMFILLSGLADAPTSYSIEDKMKQTLRTSGVAITITSLTDFLAFAIGASSVFLSVRNFCLYTGVGVLVCYMNQLMFFVPCMVLNERRVVGRRHCLTCLPIESRESLQSQGKSRRVVRCCGGSPPQSRSDNESPLERFPKFVLQRFVLFPPCKVLIIICFCIYLGFSIYGTMHVKQGLKLSNLADQRSYYHKYAVWDEEYFTTQMLVSFVFPTTLNYTDTTTLRHIDALVDTLKNETEMVTYVPEWNWLHQFRESVFSQLLGNNASVFVEGVKLYLQYRPDLINNVIFDDNGSIVASRFNVITKNLKHSTEQGNMMLRMREIAAESELDLFAHSAPFVYFEQYVAILPSTLITIGIAVVVMIIITTLFMPHPLLVALVGLTMIMILLGLFGFMYFWDLTLSSVTMIHLIMSIGFSVDFSAHICHAYICMEGTCRNSMVSAAITRSGGPIFNAAISTILGVVVLAFSSSYIFQSFFKLMFLVMLFGFAHSMFLLPVILSLIGPEVNVIPLIKEHRKQYKRQVLTNGYLNQDIKGFQSDEKQGYSNNAFIKDSGSRETFGNHYETLDKMLDGKTSSMDKAEESSDHPYENIGSVTNDNEPDVGNHIVDNENYMSHL